MAPTVAEAQRAKAIAEAWDLEQPSIGTYIGLNDLEGVKAACDFALAAAIPQFRVGLGNFEGLSQAC
ncbi:MAG: hypothetical protein R2880_21230 [Deinococcales bacterium]